MFYQLMLDVVFMMWESGLIGESLIVAVEIWNDVK